MAAAGEDPFALPAASRPGESPETAPSAVDAGYVLFVEGTVNGQPLPRLLKVRERAGTLYIAAESALYAGLAAGPLSVEELPLSSLPGVSFTFDAAQGKLAIVKRRKSDGPNAVDLSRGAPAGPVSPVQPLTALVLDYDLSLTQSRGGTRAGALVSGRVVRGNISAGSSWRYDSDASAGSSHLVRLDSAVTIRDPRALRRATLGDFVTIAPGGSRALRLAGVQIASDFSLRPDLITYPLPEFSGSVAVPTGVDLIVNDLRLSRVEVEPGDFTVRNVPVPSGRGTIGVVTRDALGREEVRSVSFYTSRELLAPGLTAYAVNAGFVRRRYGLVSGDYDALAFSGVVRRGFSRRLTSELGLEASGGFIGGGLSSDLAIGSIGALHLGGRVSQLRQQVGPPRRGGLVDFALESSGRMFSLRLDGQLVQGQYDDLASAQGDEPPRSQLAASANFDFGRRGNVSLTGVWQRRQFGPWVAADARETRVAHATYRRSLGPVSFYADLSRRSGGGEPGGYAALAGLVIPLGGRNSAQSSFSAQQGSAVGEVGFYRPDISPGDVGLSLRAAAGTSGYVQGAVSYRDDWGRIEAQGENVGGQLALRLGARGSLLLAGGDLYTAQSSGSGFVLADGQGVAGVGVLRENRPAGKTGSSGRRMIAEVPANTPVRIGIDPRGLPLDVTAAKLSDTVIVPSGAVVKIDLGVSRYVPLQLRVKSARGEDFGPGTPVRALPSGKQYLIGFDSLVEINAADGDSELRIEQGDAACHARVLDAEDGMLTCYGTSRSFPIASAAPRKP